MKKFNLKYEKRKLWIRTHKGSIIKYGTCALSLIILLVAILYFSKADFRATVTFEVIDAQVSPFVSGDIIFNAYIGEEKIDTFPQRYNEYVIDFNSIEGRLTDLLLKNKNDYLY